MAIKTFQMIMKWAHMVTPNVRHLALEREDGEPLSFIPGQFISLHFEHEGKPLRRSYSIATIPGKSGQTEFALSYFKGGAASERLFNLEPGDTLEVSGPYGRLVLREDDAPKRFVMVATGTGVTPYRAMLPAFAERMAADPALKIIVMLGVQGRAHGLYVDDFLQFAKAHPNFEFRIYYSREKHDDAASHEYFGYVQTSFDDLSVDPDNDIFYLCGNPHMIDNAVDLLKGAGFAIQQVRREKYVS